MDSPRREIHGPSHSAYSSSHFRVVCYYGVLANKIKPWFKRVSGKLFGRIKQVSKLVCWREHLISFTGKDPFRCPICRREMKLVEVAYFERNQSLWPSTTQRNYFSTIMSKHRIQMFRYGEPNNLATYEILCLFSNFAPVCGFISGFSYFISIYLSLFFSPPPKK